MSKKDENNTEKIERKMNKLHEKLFDFAKENNYSVISVVAKNEDKELTVSSITRGNSSDLALAIKELLKISSDFNTLLIEIIKELAFSELDSIMERLGSFIDEQEKS